jgi:tRNA threonylcarbamoyladenosine biosynthesis protein TsaE
MLDLEGIKNVASKLAKSIKIGDVVCLKGDLGVGKTQFSKFFIQALVGEDCEVLSPTFSLVQIYNSNIGEIWHFDLYRLNDIEEIYEIGLEQSITQAISIIEWPDIVEKLLPTSRIEINITLSKDKENFRDLSIKKVR